MPLCSIVEGYDSDVRGQDTVGSLGKSARTLRLCTLGSSRDEPLDRVCNFEAYNLQTALIRYIGKVESCFGRSDIMCEYESQSKKYWQLTSTAANFTRFHHVFAELRLPRWVYQ